MNFSTERALAPPELYPPSGVKGLLNGEREPTSSEYNISERSSFTTTRRQPEVVLTLLRILPTILVYLTPGEALYTFSGLHEKLRCEIYSLPYLKIILPPHRSVYKTLADRPIGPEHADVSRYRSFLRKRQGRALLWQILIRGDTEKLCAEEYINEWRTRANPALTQDEKIISHDVGRTFPNSSMFYRGRHNATLFRILSSTSKRYSELMGYCQGFNLVCATLLFHMNFPHVIDPSSFFDYFRNVNPCMKICSKSSSTLTLSDDGLDMKMPPIVADTPSGPRVTDASIFITRDRSLLAQEELVCRCLASMVTLMGLDKNLYDRKMEHMWMNHHTFVVLLQEFKPGILDVFHEAGFPDLQFCVCNWFLTLFSDAATRVTPSCRKIVV
eukprot:GHVH01000170.1.p1 GENE.GHVH01000170.1~~GHVH01000170.1.p1  ORF type:complete len:386 (+),score=38.29 GHVH01000170.1:47-1204(+)